MNESISVSVSQLTSTGCAPATRHSTTSQTQSITAPLRPYHFAQINQGCKVTQHPDRPPNKCCKIQAIGSWSTRAARPLLLSCVCPAPSACSALLCVCSRRGKGALLALALHGRVLALQHIPAHARLRPLSGMDSSILRVMQV